MPPGSPDDRGGQPPPPPHYPQVPPGYQPGPEPGYQQYPPPPPMPPPGSGWGTGYGKPGVIPLRPLSLSEILDGSFTTIRRYPALILGVSACVAVITGLVSLALTWALQDSIHTATNVNSSATPEEQLDELTSALPSIFGGAAAGIVISLLASTFLSGFLTIVVGRAVLGRPITFGDAMADLKPRLLPLLGLTLVYTLMIIVGAMLCIVPGVWLYVLFALASPALVLEKKSIGGAFQRSKDLVAGNWWRIFGILLLATFLAYVLSSVISIPFSLLGGGFNSITDPAATTSFGGLLVQSIGSILASTIVAPFTAIVTVLVYTDQRIRKEGLDIELARAAGMVPPPGPPPNSW